MKNTLVLMMILFSLNSWSQEFKVIPLEKDVDLSSLKKPQSKPKKALPTHSYLTPQERDDVLTKFIPKELAKMDESEKDLLYKALLQYDSERLVEKYPFLKKVKIDELKKSL